MEKWRVRWLRRKIKNDVFEDSFSKTQVLDAYGLLNYEIIHFCPKRDYSYLLKIVPHLYKAKTENKDFQKKFYNSVQTLRVRIKKILFETRLKKENYHNYRILKKILGKLDIFSLSLAEAIDYKYTENKTELIYYLIFSIKNIDVLQKLIKENPHLVNFLDIRAYNLLNKVIKAYIAAVRKHVEKKLDYLDEVIYFDQVLEVLIAHEKKHLFSGDCRELANLFAKEITAYQGVNKERYVYFLQKWQLFFMTLVDNKNVDKEAPSFKELCYIYMIRNDFSVPVLNESKLIIANEKLERKDFKTTIYTIDGEGAKELDDGFSCIRLNDAYRLGIHITAPIKYLNIPHSLIFEEATKRTTSIYNGKSAVYMYPINLATGLFSLQENTCRKVLSLYVVIDASSLQIMDSYFGFENVFVSKNDTYSHANQLLEKQNENSSYLETLNNLNEIMPLLEKYFQVDLMYQLVNRQEANLSNTNIVGNTKSEKMIEALAIFMNRYMANFALKNKFPFLYRNHELNSLYKEDLEYYRQILLKEKNSSSYINEINVLKNMYPKSYYDIVNKGHYGLNIPAYTHITSPDRRIADNYNMLMLSYWLEKKTPDITWYRYELQLKELASYINSLHNSLDTFGKYYRTKKIS